MYPQPRLCPINNQQYYLEEPYIHEWVYKGTTYRVIVPEGFITDGASIPRIFWSLAGLKPDGLYRAAALVHDFFYQYRGDPPPGRFQREVGTHKDFGQPVLAWRDVTREDRPALTRKEADELFMRIMTEAGVDGWQRTVMHRAVRLFGGFAW